MTARKPRDQLLKAPRDDTTPKPRRKKPASQNTPEKKAERIAKLRATGQETTTSASAALAKPDRPLTEKQKLFAKFWAEGETISAAAHRAGYADGATMAYRMASDPAILKLYNYEKAKYEESCQMTRKRVMEMFLESYDCAKLMSEPGNMVAAAREIGKMCGYYEPVKRTIDITVNGSVTVKQLERLSNEELLKIMQGDVEEVAFKEIEND